MLSEITNLDSRLSALESAFGTATDDIKGLINSELKEKYTNFSQSEALHSLHLALCVDTRDPWKQNRVRFFTPLLHAPDTIVDALPWAYPISAMGGFDDSGLNWVPPAGALLAIIFENGVRSSPFYLGTTWNRSRGTPNIEWGFPMLEYDEIHSGHRNGYLVGLNNGSQVLPPWNTESYNGIDIDSDVDVVNYTDEIVNITYPNIYGFKTPQKHMFKMVDGDYKCAHKDKRIEILSSCGNWFIMKDDNLREIQVPGDGSGCPDDYSCNTGGGLMGGSEYFKHENEVRPFNGPKTPQNNKCSLKQSGIQLLSISGHTFVMDDSVDEPNGADDGIPNWERSTKPFDFGCTDLYKGKTAWVSATGHRIEMSDDETESKVRSEKNYIRLLSASGNRIELNDHTLDDQKIAGEKRGILLQSTSNHMLEMIDNQNEQASPVRTEGGTPIADAKKAFVRLRSGYGLEITLNDDSSQKSTQNQSLQLFSPQKDNTDRGPHILRMQEAASGPGQLFVKAGGNYVCVTYDNHVTVVGDKEKNPSNMLTIVSSNTVLVTEEFYLNKADLHAFIADQIILLMAGKDCKEKDGSMGPCVWPVLCLSPKGITISDRVFVSASKAAGCASIFHLMPFHQCEPWKDEEEK